jgi:mono/diheme cytochrome c family protein
MTSMFRRSAHAGAAIAAAVLVMLPAPSPGQTPRPGAATFEKACYSCHSIGGGDKQGPDLKGLTARRTHDWITRFIASPSGMKASGDATAADLFRRYSPAVMPDQSLAPDQVEELLGFIDEVSASGQPFVPAGAKLARAVRPEDAELGMRLFRGEDRFVNGAPACIGCHAIEGVGALGGGALGPDLTTLNIRFRDPEVIGLLQNPTFPTMRPLFAASRLTDEEIVRLFALFQREAARVSHAPVQTTAGAGMSTRFFVVGAGVMLVTLFGMNLIWRRRLRGVRHHLLRRKQQ